MPAEFFFFSLFLQNLPRSFIASPAFLRFQYPLFYKCYLYSARFCLYLKYTEIKEKLFPLKSVAIAPESLRQKPINDGQRDFCNMKCETYLISFKRQVWQLCGIAKNQEGGKSGKLVGGLVLLFVLFSVAIIFQRGGKIITS